MVKKLNMKHLSEEHKKKISEALKGKKPKNFQLFRQKNKEYIEKYGEPMLGKHHSEEAKIKIGLANKGHKGLSGINSPNWKGDKVGYDGLHDWIQRERGNPQQCEFCGTTTAKRYEWANKSHEYKRDLTDWIRLCPSCHKRYDDVGKKVWEIRRRLYA
jgi:hypothetical protein